MTDCSNGELRDLLPDFLHGQLAPLARERVEAHLRGCDECRAELALLGSLRRTLSHAPAMDVAAITAAIPAYRPAARRAWTGWRAAAAITLLAAGGTSVAVMQRNGERARDTLAPVAQVVPVTVDLPPTAALPTAVATVPSVIPAPMTAHQAAPRELALGSSAVVELSDRELSALLADLESIEALPSPEVEPLPVTPVAPRGSN